MSHLIKMLELCADVISEIAAFLPGTDQMRLGASCRLLHESLRGYVRVCMNAQGSERFVRDEEFRAQISSRITDLNSQLSVSVEAGEDLQTYVTALGSYGILRLKYAKGDLTALSSLTRLQALDCSIPCCLTCPRLPEDLRLCNTLT